jgi:alpha-L-fucosidase 2
MLIAPLTITRVFKNKLGLIALGSCLVVSSPAAEERNALRLWYAQPAEEWTEALPVGNGHMGAMIFGGLEEERIQFNEDTLWRGKPHDYVREGAGEQLHTIQRLIFSGELETAQRLVREKFLSDPVRQLPYQPFGDLRLTFPGHDKATDYHRELDLDSASAAVKYRVGDVTFTRVAFASYPDRAIVLKLMATKAGGVSFTLKMDSPHEDSQTRAEDGEASQVMSTSDLVMSGRVQDDGLRFESRVRVFAFGGNIFTNDNAITVEEADSATLYLVAATSFKNFQDISANPSVRCSKEMEDISRRKFSDVLADHFADHQRLFRRVSLDLGRTPAVDLPTDERLARIKKEGLASDPAFAVLHFQYGRYLLIASSRPGSQPANLQGVWNELLNPPWESKYTLNINCEMNYWPAGVCNLKECEEPLFDMIDDLVISGSRTARKQYGARGWVVHHNTDLWRGTAPINNIDGQWPTGGAWLSHHLWDHYLFTGDRRFLAERAYPVMKGAALFFVDFLVRDPETGWLVTNPSHSPEQSPPDQPTLGYGPTMDNQLIRALFGYVIEAAEILGTDQEFAAELAELREQLPPNLVGRHGQLQEWIKDWDQPGNRHRHMSPLWGLYPGWEITPEDGRIYDAAKVLLDWRGIGDTGWSYAWRIPLWARVGDGDFAHRQFYGLLNRRTLPNLFDLCGPFQIDGNFGACAGVAEVLLQSHLVDTRNSNSEIRILDLLPALPKAWPDGSVTGLLARGGFEVDIKWKDGAFSGAVIRSELGLPVKIRCGEREVLLETTSGQEYSLDGRLEFLK